ncbi:hypothetical protein FRC06_001830, partial [Ceratobasidium sp. 370]
DEESINSSKEPNSTYAAKAAEPNDHPTLQEAMEGHDQAQWLAAMEEEYAQLSRLHTFSLVLCPPPPHNIIGNRWVLAHKCNEAGDIIRYKARLVAKGFTQKPGQDFDNTFAPVLRLDALRILSSLANYDDWDIRQLDVVGAFLNGKLEEELCMDQIPHVEDGTRQVLHLHRTIYGLKQSAHVWNCALDNKLKAMGYLRLLTDSCVYRCVTETIGEPLISIVAVHVCHDLAGCDEMTE